MENDVCPLGPLPHFLPAPQKGAPLTELPQREMLRFHNPLSLKIPSHRIPQVPQRAPTGRHTCLYSFLLPLSLKVPVNEHPSMFPNRVPMEKLHLQSQLFIPSFISVRVPSKGPSHEKKGENIWSPSTEPHVDGRPTYSGVWPGSPGVSFMTQQSLPQCHCSLQHDTFHLGLGRPEQC
jgi:hypothetical protein